MVGSYSTKIRLLGSLGGLIVGAIVGALIGMGFDNVLFAAVVGACIGLILGFCFPRIAGHLFDAFINPL